MRVKPKVIILSLKETGNVTLTAKTIGISRQTVYRWRQKARTYGGKLTSRGLARLTTRPKTIHYKLDLSQKSKIQKVRESDHVGARKIRRMLYLPLSDQTVHRFLKTKGLVSRQTKYRRPHFQNGLAMRPANTRALGYVQMDTKHVTPELSGLAFTCYEYAAIDILSRYKLAVVLPDIDDESASLALEFFLKWSPFKVSYIQTDNGLEYQRAFETTCRKHQIKHYYIHKNSPNENAVIERSFRTDQDEFYYWLEEPPLHIGQLNDWLQKFMTKYNTSRLHQALGYKTPLEVVQLYQGVT